MSICAVSTPPGVGGIAVVRVSGENAFEICDKIYHSKRGILLKDQKPYTLSYGQIIVPTTKKVLDEVVVATFRAPHSFTGDHTVEISCHGSAYIQQQLLILLVEAGAQLAGPGEFTQRAFLNGRLDLSQAEAVADLIASTSEASNRLALNQMRGGFSSKLHELREKLLTFVSLIELELDFSEEDVEFADRTQLRALAEEIHTHISKLVDSFAIGNAMKNGIPVALVGETNVGKSTLLNQLLHEDRAIVSDIHGTTRDTIEDVIVLKGTQFRFIDTAGLRDTKDKIENLGIERSYRKIKQAQIILWLVDSVENDNLEAMGHEIMELAAGKDVIILINKTDKIDAEALEALKQRLADLKTKILPISAKKGNNIEALEQLLVSSAGLEKYAQQDILVTNVRHFEALKQAKQSIALVEEGLKTDISTEFLSQDIRECMHYLGLITGDITTDEVLHNIFSHFCIGK